LQELALPGLFVERLSVRVSHVEISFGMFVS